MHDITTLSEIYRYPVKGLSPQALTKAELKVDHTLPLDRIYAIENGPGRFNPASPQHLPKINFLMLMRNEKLAALNTEFEPEGHILKIFRQGKQVARGDLKTALGRQIIEQFFAAFMKDELRGSPKIVFADDHSFSDVQQKCIHIVNLETLRILEREFGKTIDPLRFRANFYIDGLKPWQEFHWVDKTLQIGSSQLKVFTKTDRCDAINVDPKTGERDMSISKTLIRTYDHNDVGVYATVIKDGEVKCGDSIKLL